MNASLNSISILPSSTRSVSYFLNLFVLTKRTSPFPSWKESQEKAIFLQVSPISYLTTQSVFAEYSAPSWVKKRKLSPAPTTMSVSDFPAGQI